MKTPEKIIFSLVLIIVSMTGTAQKTDSSTWVIDNKSSFTFQNIKYSEGCDTVIFKKNASFKSDMITFNNADEIIYLRQSKTVIIISGDPHFVVTKPDAIKFAASINESAGEGVNKIKYWEYTIGDHVVYGR